MGISTITLWGPVYWRFLHEVGAQHQGQSLESMYSTLSTLANTIPCNVCREHFHSSLERDVADAPEKEIEKWLFDCHNAVNARLKKPTMSWVAYKHLQRQHLSSSENEPCNEKHSGRSPLLIVCCAIFLLLLVFSILALMRNCLRPSRNKAFGTSTRNSGTSALY